jgi:hypothetical protein
MSAPRKTAASTNAPEPAGTVRVASSYPHGPVHVGDGTPLTHTEDRVVTDTPEIRALIADGHLSLVTEPDEQES